MPWKPTPTSDRATRALDQRRRSRRGTHRPGSPPRAASRESRSPRSRLRRTASEAVGPPNCLLAYLTRRGRSGRHVRVDRFTFGPGRGKRPYLVNGVLGAVSADGQRPAGQRLRHVVRELFHPLIQLRAVHPMVRVELMVTGAFVELEQVPVVLGVPEHVAAAGDHLPATVADDDQAGRSSASPVRRSIGRTSRTMAAPPAASRARRPWTPAGRIPCHTGFAAVVSRIGARPTRRTSSGPTLRVSAPWVQEVGQKGRQALRPAPGRPGRLDQAGDLTAEESLRDPQDGRDASVLHVLAVPQPPFRIVVAGRERLPYPPPYA